MPKSMIDHWTLPLSEEGMREIEEERETRPVETSQRLEMLARVRDAVRSLECGGTQGFLNHSRSI